MATKTKTVTKQKTKPTTGKGTADNEGSRTGTTTVAVARATVTKADGARENVYEDAVKEIVALSENDTYAKKVDNGPLNESRGKDTWRLHTQLRAIDQHDKNASRQVAGLREALSAIDEHLNADAGAITSLVSQTRSDVQKWITGTRGDVQEWITGTRDAVTSDIESFHKSVRDSFGKLSQATAGTEENLRRQTDAFSKAVENLMANVHAELDKRIAEFRDEATRLIDKRFNQSDVAFAAIRADQEVIKALLTDIIKDRLGRPDARNR